jgi:hypothetical protein
MRGKPGISPAQLAMVTVLQFAENLTDRQAADPVRGRLDCRLKLVSPYDPGARYSEKRGKGWAGYKVNISETCHEPAPDSAREAPNLITSVATTEATVPGAAMTEPIHDMLKAAGLAPASTRWMPGTPPPTCY